MTAGAAPADPEVRDLFVIGGGVNGCGIARDAAGRGLSVTLAEMGDLASATSSASTKLFHGGLRYLEYFDLRLVREALREREVLLRAMPHISWPLRFVLPYHPAMRFDSDTPTARLLALALPWMRGRRPAWLLRLGLFLYDHMGGRQVLPATRTLALAGRPEGAPLQDRFERAYEYSDCWVQDARLVVLNARDAADRGAEILTRTRVLRAERSGGLWLVETEAEDGSRRHHRARALVNAAGPWVAEVLRGALGQPGPTAGVRLVRGSHIVTHRLFDHDKCYFFQGTDGRIVFAIPYEEDFTLVGTTDADHPDPDLPPVCTEAEADYLRGFVSDYLRRPVTREDIVWRFSGVRPLYDPEGGSATAATREYVLDLQAEDKAGNGAPLLNVFGGKITTYRKLAEAALARLAPHFPGLPGPWTAGASLPGGDFAVDGAPALARALRARHGFLTEAWARRLVRHYGTDAWRLLEGAERAADLGEDLGATLTMRELAWLARHEWARTAEDVLWRRTKLGLRLTPEQAARVEVCLQELRQAGPAERPEAR
jgi:glycerol-3-phosphate dehydrogenase